MKLNLFQWREIEKRTYYKHQSCPKYSGGSVILHLSCGHEAHRKASEEPKLGARVRCRQCELTS